MFVCMKVCSLSVKTNQVESATYLYEFGLKSFILNLPFHPPREEAGLGKYLLTLIAAYDVILCVSFQDGIN